MMVCGCVYNALSNFARRVKKVANITVSATAGMMLIGSAFAMFVTAATNQDTNWLKWCALGFAIMGVVSWYWAIAQAKQHDSEAKQDRGRLFAKMNRIIQLLKK